jgi:dTDP-4-amino-4,6-dideoxygalactose transaminase
VSRPPSVPFFDYRPLHRRLEAPIEAAIRRVVASGQLILGPEVRAFEAEFAAWVGARAAVGVASGTDALELALRALGIGAGDEVLTVANAGVPTVAAIRAAGATPRFVDVDPDTLLLDPAGLEAALTPRTRAVLPVHLYGQPAPLEPILAFARRHGLRVVEDCAQAHGARIGPRHVGSFGDAGCFSFYPTKNLGAYGDGGMCVTGDPEIEERLRRLRSYGFDAQRSALCEGRNSRLDELQAAILRAKLVHLDAVLEERRALARRYREALAGGACEPVAEREGVAHAYHLFVVRAAERERAQRALADAGVGSAVHYPEPVHRMPAYAFLGYAAGSLPRTERACARVLSLPLYPGLSDEALARAISALRA